MRKTNNNFDPLCRLPSLLPIACACTRAQGSLLDVGDEGGFSLRGDVFFLFCSEVEVWMHDSLEQVFS